MDKVFNKPVIKVQTLLAAKDEKIERLRKTLEVIRKIIYDRGWVNLTEFDRIVQAQKEGK